MVPIFAVVAAVLFAIGWLSEANRADLLWPALFFLALHHCWEFGYGLWVNRPRG